MFRISFPLQSPGAVGRAVLHAIGIDIITLTLLRREQTLDEQPKPILQHGFLLALGRCTAHILPMFLFIGLIYINYSTLYIGPTFVMDPDMDALFLAAFQLAAKAQELLCVGSLSAIVLQALRSEMLDDGVPLGLLGSGIWYTSLSSFWSPEFLFALPWGRKRWRSARLIFLLVLAGGTATVIGPASAVLMLPRSQNFPAGGTSFFLDGTADQLWPATLNASSEPEICRSANATEVPFCPSAGFQSLQRAFNFLNKTNPCFRIGQEFSPECQAIGAEGNRKWNNFLLQSPQSAVPPMLNSIQFPDHYQRTAAAQPSVACITHMQQLIGEWHETAKMTKKRSLRQLQWTYELETAGSVTSPWVRSRCTKAQNLSASATEALFPYMNWRNEQDPDPAWRNVSGFQRDGRSSDISMLERNETSRLRTQWFPLALDDFGDHHSGQTATGVLIELPWSQGSRVALGCSIAAAWHDGLVRSVRSKAYGAWGNTISGDDFGNLVDSPDAPLYNRPVQLTTGWLDLLTRQDLDPSTTSGNHRSNTMEKLMSNFGLPDVVATYRNEPQLVWSDFDSICRLTAVNKSLTNTELWNDDGCGKGGKFFSIEMVIAAVVVDGLARHGSHHAYAFQTDTNTWQVKPLQTYNSTGLLAHLPTAPPPLTSNPTAWLEVYVNGYAYYPSTVSDYLALAVVGLYMLLAGSHVLSTLVLPNHRTTSGAWDTITELFLLCYKSLPPSTPRLKNTSAGIHRSQTYGVIVRVRAAKANIAGEESTHDPIHNGKHEEEQLHLIAGGDEEKTDCGGDDERRSISCGRCDALHIGSSTQGLLEMQPWQSSSLRTRTKKGTEGLSVLGAGRFWKVERDVKYS